MEALADLAAEREASFGPALRLGRFFCHARLGASAVTETFRARLYGLAGLDRPYVVVRVRPDRVAAWGERFLEAAHGAAAFVHPSAARIVHVGDEGGVPFVASELVHGVNLRQVAEVERTRGDGQLSPVLAAWIGARVADVLGAAHLSPGRLVHGALGAGNVIVTGRAEVRVLDFAIRAATRDRELDDLAQLVPLAPEVLAGGKPTPRSDLFALGALLYDLAAGRPPFMVRSAAGLADAMRQPPPPLAGVPDDFATIVARLLAASPAGRPASAEEARRALDAVVAARPDVNPARLALSLVSAARARTQEAGLRLTEFVTVALKPQTAAPDVTAARPPVGGALPQATVAADDVTESLADMARREAEMDAAEQAEAAAELSRDSRTVGGDDLESVMVEPVRPADSELMVTPVRPADSELMMAPVPAPAAAPGGATPDDETIDASDAVEIVGETTKPGAPRVTLPPPLPTAMPAAVPTSTTLVGVRAPTIKKPIDAVVATEDQGAARYKVPRLPTPLAVPTSKTLVGVAPPRRAEPPPSRPSRPVVPSVAPDEEPIDVSLPAPIEAEDASAPPVSEFAPPPTSVRPPFRMPVAPASSAAALAAREALTARPRQAPVTATAAAATRGRSPAVLGALVVAAALAVGGWWAFEHGFLPGKTPPVAPPVAAPVTRAAPRATPTATASATPTASASAKPTASAKPAPSPAPSPSPSPVLAKVPAGPVAAGHVRVSSKPVGADVWVDGVLAGQTPIDVPVKARSARVVVIAAGHAMAKAEVKAGDSFDAKLEVVQAPTRGPAGIKVRCKTEGRFPVLVDGKETGMLCPTERIGVTAAGHEVAIFVPALDKTVAIFEEFEAGDSSARVRFKQ